VLHQEYAMKPLTWDTHQDFTARMREAADYIAKRVKGRMQPVIRNTAKDRKSDRPKREEKE